MRYFPILMFVQRFLLLAVVLSAILHAQQPALASIQPVDAPRAPAPTWTDRKTVKFSRSITRMALLQRLAVARSAAETLQIDHHPAPVVYGAAFHPSYLHLPPPTRA